MHYSKCRADISPPSRRNAVVRAVMCYQTKTPPFLILPCYAFESLI
jgi:hypothetical protein